MRRAEKGGPEQRPRRSHGGFSTRLHAVVDTKGRPIYIAFMPVQRREMMKAAELLASAPGKASPPAPATTPSIRQTIRDKKKRAVIGSKPERPRKLPKSRAHLKRFRARATRFEKAARNSSHSHKSRARGHGLQETRDITWCVVELEEEKMRYQLFGSNGSGSGIVEMALAEIGADYELHEVALQTEQQRSSDYARLNPQRKLPTLLTPEGETLTESSAIVLVLDERHPEARLLPARGTPARAQALRWLAFLAAEMYPIIEIVDYPARFAPDAASAPGVREVAQGIWRERWLVLEHVIAGSPWLLASGFCWTDVYLAVLSRWSLAAEWRAQHLPKAERIATAVAERERIRAVWQRHHGKQP